jgi:hypothetical protein
MAQGRIGFSEGTTGDNPRAIRRSDYVSLASCHLARDRGDMVIFGFSFGAHDSPATSAPKTTNADQASPARPQP